MTNDIPHKMALNVWYKTDLVGKLERNQIGMMSFRYEKHWVEQGFAISQELPLQYEEYSAALGIAHQFFANLLPEADARMHIVRDLKISNSDFELLKAIGGECAGAFSILPTEHNPNVTYDYKKLSKTELKQILVKKGQIFNITSAEDRPRLSLAGAQDKCPLFFDGKNYFLPKDAAPSTHILKFEIAGYRNIPVYEYFMTELAKKIGLPVVDIELHENDGDHYLLIKRYDRILHSQNHVTRLHQEDFCQALGVSFEHKYEQEGGPSFRDCYNLVQKVTQNPVDDLNHLLRWQIFNVLAGNSDGHAKNLALFYNHGHHAELAPFYDLVCTRAIERIDAKLALSVGGEFNPNNILLKHWEKLAKDCEINYPYLKKIIQEMAELLPISLNTTQKEFEEKFGPYPALQRMQSIVLKQCKKTLAQFKN